MVIPFCIKGLLMKQSLEAIYEDGVFKPTKHLEIPNGQQVRLEVETLSSI